MPYATTEWYNSFNWNNFNFDLVEFDVPEGVKYLRANRSFKLVGATSNFIDFKRKFMVKGKTLDIELENTINHKVRSILLDDGRLFVDANIRCKNCYMRDLSYVLSKNSFAATKYKSLELLHS